MSQPTPRPTPSEPPRLEAIVIPFPLKPARCPDQQRWIPAPRRARALSFTGPRWVQRAMGLLALLSTVLVVFALATLLTVLPIAGGFQIP